MIHAAICDDEPYMRNDLASKLRQYMAEKGLACEVLCCASGEELLESDQPLDFALLDIQMEGASGMDTAKKLRSRGFAGPIVFVTVLEEFVFDSFEVEAADYLVKPLEDLRFYRTMDRVCRQLEKLSSTNVLTIRRGGSCRLVSLSHICYCEVIDRKVYIHTDTGETIDYYFKIEKLEALLTQDFFRCHRSYLVNLGYVRGFENGMAFLADYGAIPVSRSRQREFTQAVLQYMKGKER